MEFITPRRKKQLIFPISHPFMGSGHVVTRENRHRPASSLWHFLQLKSQGVHFSRCHRSESGRLQVMDSTKKPVTPVEIMSKYCIATMSVFILKHADTCQWNYFWNIYGWRALPTLWISSGHTLHVTNSSANFNNPKAIKRVLWNEANLIHVCTDG